MSAAKMKLSGISTLIVDGDSHSVRLLENMLRGFGLDTLTVANSGAKARLLLEKNQYELCLCEADLPDMSGVEVVHWTRRLAGPTRFVPILALTGYSSMNVVIAMRDAGTHLILKKPVSPQLLYDHISWAATSSRPFIETETYIGPDRRFKSIGPPNGVGRRQTDLSADIGEATAPNMSQEEIDALVKPMKVFAE